MLKQIAILVNILILAYLFFATIIYGLGDMEAKFFLFFLVVIIILLINLYAIISSKEGDWISLYFKRKAMEEKKRIQELENK